MAPEAANHPRPWLVLAVSALFIAVDIAMRHGLEPALSTLVGSGDEGGLWRVGVVGAVSANVVNNLPAA